MKVFTAALSTETNTFSPMPTSMEDFAGTGLFRPCEAPDEPMEFAAPLWVARERADNKGWQVVEGTCAFAVPAGPTERGAYEALRDEILDQITAALPLDVVAMSMHGAMVADGYPDCEGNMLEHIRRIVGDDVVIGLELDPHCHLSEAMLTNADAIVMYKEYPHTDFVERAEDILDILEATVDGRVRPCMSVFNCRMLDFYHTTRQPMKGFLDRIKALEKEDGILSISVAHGFPWGDVAEGGTKVLVVTDNDPTRGDAIAESLGMELFSLRGKTHAPVEDMATVIARAAAAPKGPIVLADTSDNPGGGAPGDSTFVLNEMFRQGVSAACVGALWDAAAVGAAFDAGIGATLDLQIGGKNGSVSGKPLNVRATVIGLCSDARQSFAQISVSLGDCAAIRCEGIDIVLTTLRCQTLGLDLFTNVGIQPGEKKIVVVKSSQHFYDAFAPIAHEILYVDSPGALTLNLLEIDYRHLPRDIWPFVQDPFSGLSAVTQGK